MARCIEKGGRRDSDLEATAKCGDTGAIEVSDEGREVLVRGNVKSHCDHCEAMHATVEKYREWLHHKLEQERELFDRLIALESAAASPAGVTRSEEHTSELQSLMRISYAVFCL